MIEVSSLVLVIAFEVILLSVVVTIGLVVALFIKKRRDRAAAKKLAARIKEEAQSRVADMQAHLQNRFGQSVEEAEAVAKKVGFSERQFYQTMLSVYLQRDHHSLANLKVSFEEAVQPYRDIQVDLSGNVGSSDGGGEPAGDASQLKLLQDENERLKDELSITMDTMGRMISEYSSMFSGGAEGEPSQDGGGGLPNAVNEASKLLNQSDASDQVESSEPEVAEGLIQEEPESAVDSPQQADVVPPQEAEQVEPELAPEPESEEPEIDEEIMLDDDLDDGLELPGDSGSEAGDLGDQELIDGLIDEVEISKPETPLKEEAVEAEKLNTQDSIDDLLSEIGVDESESDTVESPATEQDQMQDSVDELLATTDASAQDDDLLELGSDLDEDFADLDAEFGDALDFDDNELK